MPSGMFRLAASLVTLLASLIAVPAAAQSLPLVAIPVVFVSRPVIQPTHQGQTVAALPQHRQQQVSHPLARAAGFAAAHPRPYDVGALPVWKAAPAIDRGLRDYRRGLAQYGPFLVLDRRTVALVGETNATTPGFFRAMMRDFPGIEQLDMVECPGTQDDRANLKVGRMIRAAGLVTHVPAIGSVRSGAVELFLAGVDRDIADGAEFAVHSWMDDYGREAADFAADAPENRQYIDYYREMGMSDGEAHAFYDFTNSVPNVRALWLDARDMRRWARPGASVQARRNRKAEAPRLSYGDMTFS